MRSVELLREKGRCREAWSLILYPSVSECSSKRSTYRLHQVFVPSILHRLELADPALCPILHTCGLILTLAEAEVFYSRGRIIARYLTGRPN